LYNIITNCTIIKINKERNGRKLLQWRRRDFVVVHARVHQDEEEEEED
jgi:hypothetical protein